MEKALKNKDMLTTEEVAKRLRLGRHVVSKMARNGIIPAKKTGKGKNCPWRFYWPAVEKAFSGTVSEATK